MFIALLLHLIRFFFNFLLFVLAIGVCASYHTRINPNTLLLLLAFFIIFYLVIPVYLGLSDFRLLSLNFLLNDVFFKLYNFVFLLAFCGVRLEFSFCEIVFFHFIVQNLWLFGLWIFLFFRSFRSRLSTQLLINFLINLLFGISCALLLFSFPNFEKKLNTLLSCLIDHNLVINKTFNNFAWILSI